MINSNVNINRVYKPRPNTIPDGAYLFEDGEVYLFEDGETFIFN